jgi:hypothetical protein
VRPTTSSPILTTGNITAAVTVAVWLLAACGKTERDYARTDTGNRTDATGGSTDTPRDASADVVDAPGQTEGASANPGGGGETVATGGGSPRLGGTGGIAGAESNSGAGGRSEAFGGAAGAPIAGTAGEPTAANAGYAGTTALAGAGGMRSEAGAGGVAGIELHAGAGGTAGADYADCEGAVACEPCEDEGARCSSSDATDVFLCTTEHLCFSGNWTLSEVCHSEPRCPWNLPHEGAACDQEGLECTYGVLNSYLVFSSCHRDSWLHRRLCSGGVWEYLPGLGPA